LGELVHAVLPLVRPMAGHLGVELLWSKPEAPVLIRGDENGLSQLAINLTLNAIEAASSHKHRGSPAHGGQSSDRTEIVETAPPMVEVRIASQAAPWEVVRLEITDTGSGPAARVQDHIFEPLVTDKPDGAGLGLPVAREIAHLHGGEIRWERRGGRTCFIVDFPAWKEAPHAAAVGG
jgi:signal transduction histidine kinase